MQITATTQHPRRRHHCPSRGPGILGLGIRVLGVCAGVLALVALGGCDGPGSTVAQPTGSTPASIPPPGSGSGGPTPSASRSKADTGTPPAPVPAATLPPDSGPVQCPAATRTVRTAEELAAALAQAGPGDSISLRAGSYVGKFTATVSGTAGRPVFLCGPAGAVLDGGGIKAGYVLHLNGASYWRLVGFTVRNGQKGVVADRSQHSVIQGLTVEDIGDEGIHLRTFSSDNLVVGNTVRRTGQRREKFGEGVYVGSAVSNWCTYSACKPDRSDRNVIRGNRISATTAECVDIKEGTTGGVVAGNTFDGSALSGADSWVDVKGNGWLIEGNTGQRSPQDGFQSHEVAPGWGTGNVFRANVAVVDGPGYGIHLAPIAANKISCDNRALGARLGLSNARCS